MIESEQRIAVVAEALTWAGTPWRHHSRVKGAGVDCAMLVAEVFERCGLFPRVDPGPYAKDAHLHRDGERVLEQLEQFAVRRPDGEEPQPGDVALFRYGRSLSHAGIVTSYPYLIHAWIGIGVTVDSVVANSDLSRRLGGYWNPWGKR